MTDNSSGGQAILSFNTFTCLIEADSDSSLHVTTCDSKAVNEWAVKSHRELNQFDRNEALHWSGFRSVVENIAQLVDVKRDLARKGV